VAHALDIEKNQRIALILSRTKQCQNPTETGAAADHLRFSKVGQRQKRFSKRNPESPLHPSFIGIMFIA
jgi:hypothetical protein